VARRTHRTACIWSWGSNKQTINTNHIISLRTRDWTIQKPDSSLFNHKQVLWSFSKSLTRAYLET
jgi:hypothetical protein